MNTWERITAIEAHMKQVIENTDFETDLGIVLNEVIMGNKARSVKFRPPLVWVFPSPSIIDDESTALNEYWKLRYTIVGAIKEHDVDEGKRLAEQLAIMASTQFVISSQARSMGGLAQDTVRTGWLPAQDRVTNEDTLFGAGVEIEVRFQTREVC